MIKATNTDEAKLPALSEHVRDWLELRERISPIEDEYLRLEAEKKAAEEEERRPRWATASQGLYGWYCGDRAESVESEARKSSARTTRNFRLLELRPKLEPLRARRAAIERLIVDEAIAEFGGARS